MRKFTFFMALCLAFSANIFAQTLVSTEIQKRNVILEEYTGIHCGYCPEGHAIAAQLHEDYPNQIFPIAIHQGSFAVPGSGEPDYRTEFGDALAGQTGLTGYPSGTVNRHVFSGSNTALGRSSWAPSSMEIIGLNSIVNVGAATTYNAATRELTVDVELYYTGDSPESINLLNIALLQNGILGPQSGGNAGNNYEHNHMLRHLITGQWGVEITNTTQGSFIQETFTYTIPEDYNDVECIVEDCDIAVFVTETHQEIYSGVAIPAIDGTTLITATLSDPEHMVALGTPGQETNFNMDFMNVLSEDEEYEFTLTAEDDPDGWGHSFTINGNTYTETATESISSGTTSDLSINVTPDSETGFAKFKISIQSVSNPNTISITKEVYVVSNVETLLLNNQGTWNGGTPASLEDDYFTAFDAGNIQYYTSCEYKAFILAAQEEDIISSFMNIFFNVAWTFPGLTDQNVEILSNFINNGGNLFIAGQDLGWDTWDGSGNGTDITKDFYSNYLNADYISDGSTSNNKINPNTDDEIFGSLGTSTIIDIYGGNMYPDEIEAINDGIQITYYNDGTSKGSGVRSIIETGKVVYLGFDPSMVVDEEVRNDLIIFSYDWFMDGVGVQEIEDFDMEIFPVPVKDQLNIMLSKTNSVQTNVKLVSILGSLVFERNYSNESDISIDTKHLNNGIYILSVENGQQKTSRQIVINK